MIDTIQIQTIEKCNAKCIMCPRRMIFQSGKEMLFSEIEWLANQIKKAQDKKIIASPCRIIMSFQNEPLTDSCFFWKLKEIKNKVNCTVEFYTNGILINKYKDKLIKNKKLIKEIICSNYGDDMDRWRIVTNFKIAKKKFDEMKKAIKEVGDHIRIRKWNAWNEDILYDFSTRAGLIKTAKAKEAVLGCAWNRPNEWLHIHSNGDIVLCCQDWKRETMFGNVFKSGLHEILTQNHYRFIMDQATSKKESDKNFICKRCKFNVDLKETVCLK